MERNPVSVTAAKPVADDDVVSVIMTMDNASIYGEAGRLAQPDEVWNYNRGDGVEKAVLLANILKARSPTAPARIEVSPDRAILTVAGRSYPFVSSKGLKEQTWDL